MTAPTLIDNRYQLISRVGGGGMGQVYFARDTRLKSEVAVKLLNPSIAANPKARQRFMDEMQMLAAMRTPGHSNIGLIYDGNCDGETPYIVMEFIRGTSLEKILEQGSLPTEVATSIACQILDGIGYANGKGVVHRDIKPGNILVTADGVVKVIDFGIARGQQSGGMTMAGDVIGTVNYISPEQALGKPIDQTTDVYAIGTLLFEMLTGSVPLDKGEIPATIVAHANEDAPPLPDQFGSGLVGAVAKSLVRNKDGRHQSTGEFKVALEAAGVVPGSGRQSDTIKDYVIRNASAKTPVRPSADTIIETPKSGAARVATPSGRRSRITWMIYASGGVLMAAGLASIWLVREIRERSAPIPLPAIELKVPEPPGGWDTPLSQKPDIQSRQILPKPAKAPAVAAKAPAVPAMPADERKTLESRRDAIQADLKKYSAQIASLRALGENQARQSELETSSVGLKAELDSIEKKLSGR